MNTENSKETEKVSADKSADEKFEDAVKNFRQEMEKGKIPCAMLRKRFHARRPEAFAPGRSSTNIQIAGIPGGGILT